MRRKRLGRSGLKVSALGLGTANWGVAVNEHVGGQILRAYLSAHGNLIDTADFYGLGAAESLVGRLLATMGVRDEVILATKAGGTVRGPNASAAHLRQALDESLRRLGVDYVDLWQVHDWDGHAPLEETLRTLDWAVSTGRVRYVGVCNYSGPQTADAVDLLAASGLTTLTSTQLEYSLLNRSIERDIIPLALTHGIDVIAWGSLGRGMLTGKYLDDVPPHRADDAFFQRYVGQYIDRSTSIARAVVDVAHHLGHPPAAVAGAWASTRPGIGTALVGARSPHQLTESLAAAWLTLDGDTIELLNQASSHANITELDVDHSIK